MMLIFDRSINTDANTEYEQWSARNSDAFVINERGRDARKMHRVACGHFKGFPDPVNLARNRKICSTNDDELRRFASQHNWKLDFCGHCM